MQLSIPCNHSQSLLDGDAIVVGVWGGVRGGGGCNINTINAGQETHLYI